MFKVLWSSVLLLLLGIIHVDAGVVDSAPVKVWLRSSWAASDLLLEIIETVALENSANFFPAFDLLTSPQSGIVPSPSRSQKEVYDLAIETLEGNAFFTEPNSKATLELSLSLHVAAPKIEAFHQFYMDQFDSGNDTDRQRSWVDWYGERLRDVDTLKAKLENADCLDRPLKVLPFDHIYPIVANERHSACTAILYVSFESLDFWDLHRTLFTASQHPLGPQYIIRYIPPRTDVKSPRHHLTGYGVALDLKKTDYLAVDDRRSMTKGDEVPGGTKVGDETPFEEDDDSLLLDALREFPEFENVTEQTRQLDKDELADIGLKATSLIINSTSPFTMLRQISQNFPKYATSLARRVPEPSEDLRNEAVANEIMASHLFSGVWINGLKIAEKDLNPFGLIQFLRKERRRMLALTTLGLSPSEAVEVISHPAIEEASQPSRGLSEGYFDASDREEGGDTIIWWNDIETNSQYSRWPRSLASLLRGTFPGQFHTVRRNLNNIVVVLDLSRLDSLRFISGPVAQIISRGLPFRFGVVPMLETERSLLAARLILYSVEKFGRTNAIRFIDALADADMDLGLARVAYDNLVRTYVPPEEGDVEPPLPFEKVISDAPSSTPLAAHLERASQYARRLSTTTASHSAGHGFINGKYHEFNEEFLRAVQMESAAQILVLQEVLYTGELNNDDNRDMSVYFYDLPTTSKRRNVYVYPSTKAGSLKVFSMPELFNRSGIDRAALDYIYPESETPVLATVWVVGNLIDPSHFDLFRQAIRAQNSSASFRLSYLHIAEDPRPSDYRLMASILLRLRLNDGVLTYPTSAEDILDLVNLSSSDDSDVEDVEDHPPRTYHESALILGRLLGLKEGDMALIVNGRLIGPIEPGGFTSLDFDALLQYELAKRITPVFEALNTTYSVFANLDFRAFTEMVTMTSSIISAANVPDASAQGLSSSPPLSRNRVYQNVGTNFSSFEAGDMKTSMFQIAAILDPLTEAAQKVAPLLNWLSQLEYSYTQVILFPTSHTQLPLKRFYRYNLLHSLSFDPSGRISHTPLVFRGLPPDPIYTLAMDVPQSWLVRPRESPHDLDNIHLASLAPHEISQGVEAVFDLDFLVIEGHAREPSNAPPRGVQLQLTDASGSLIADTLVMANLGYLQFRAKPGVFKLGIRPGRGQEVYEMESVGNEGWDSPNVKSVGDEVTLTSFEGLTLFPRLKRRFGMTTAEVLAPSESQPSIFSSVVSWLESHFGGSKSSEVAQQADINIFTVASGLLYERFVGIMILSVLKNTHSSVKFWFIENFLSPSFLEFIPHLASAYNFQYELVTYKWPSWLRAQTEKQRVIWAYKILFLDVLFPMDLKKVIFVDADQIVRADLKELIELDLEGAPYGYTPMGDDSEGMEGFRFWKTGYWKEFLRGSSYHISALYVIDLVRFRQLAAGDRLRGQYHGLSADPNSLANLDQDLPNHMQHEIPIYSLDKNWLWCETWCSKDRLDQAKTIDLCQNPRTKEPKLDRARQIPEWEVYDAEIANFARRLVQEGKIHGGAIAASSNDLASIGTQAPKQSGSEGEARKEETAVNERHVPRTGDEL